MPADSFYLRKLDGSPAVRLGEGTGRAFSPDGQRVLGMTDVHTSQLVPVGAGTTKVISHLDIWSYFQWFHPDGQRVLLNGRLRDQPYRFWFMDESGKLTEAGPPGLDHWAGQDPLSNDGRLLAAFKSGQNTAKEKGRWRSIRSTAASRFR
jgi:hypothetical protein